MDHSLFIHSYVRGHLGCLHVLDTAKNTDISRACETKSRMQGWMNSVQDKELEENCWRPLVQRVLEISHSWRGDRSTFSVNSTNYKPFCGYREAV